METFLKIDCFQWEFDWNIQVMSHSKNVLLKTINFGAEFAFCCFEYSRFLLFNCLSLGSESLLSFYLVQFFFSFLTLLLFCKSQMFLKLCRDRILFFWKTAQSWYYFLTKLIQQQQKSDFVNICTTSNLTIKTKYWIFPEQLNYL